MKKSATPSDQEIELELIKSQKSLYEGKNGITLINTLKSKFPQAHGFYLLNWIPEQGEDIFWVLVSPEIVAVVEILRDGKQVSDLISCSQISVKKYLEKRLSPQSRKKFDIAIRLLANQRGRLG
jgi:hypothetical protein